MKIQESESLTAHDKAMIGINFLAVGGYAIMVCAAVWCLLSIARHGWHPWNVVFPILEVIGIALIWWSWRLDRSERKRKAECIKSTDSILSFSE